MAHGSIRPGVRSPYENAARLPDAEHVDVGSLASGAWTELGTSAPDFARLPAAFHAVVSTVR